jgi:ADP-ribose pyrophosphatase
MPNETNRRRRESRRTIFEGRIITVTVERVTLPNGHTVDLEFVRHPGSVVLLPMPAPDRIVLIRQFRPAIDRAIWELPAGSLKRGEDPALAAARECEEEIGLVPARLDRLRSFYPTPGYCDEDMIFFRCLELGPPASTSTAHKDADEDIEPRTFTLKEARAMVESGEIVDMKTAVGLTLV